MPSYDARAAALEAAAAGLSVIPPKEDGSKAPGGQWGKYQVERASIETINLWYGTEGIPKRTGCGLVCGAISGNLECFEFDACGRLYEHYKATARGMGRGDLIDRLDQGYLERSPSGGFHWLYRCAEISGNAKLAVAEDGISLIETRGEGGYIIVAPSNGQVHPTGGAYKLLAGGFGSIPIITPEERTFLWNLARLFDETPGRPDPWTMRVESIGNTAPWDQYNAATNWRDLLIEHGWTHVFTRDGVQHWRRPGKDHSHSATVNHGGTDRLKCFSSSCEFDNAPGVTYSRFGAYAVWEHGGDWKAAIKAIKKQFDQDKARPKPPPEGTPIVVRLDQIDPKEVCWLWPGRVPRGFITIFYGTTGVGKSFVALDIAARLTRGDSWPDSSGECCDPGNVLLISEDPFEYVLAPRLIELGAVMSKVYAMTWEAMQTWAIDDVETLGRAFKESGDPVLIVIDPPTNFLGEIDEHKNAEVRSALMQLVIWLDSRSVSVACILITHTNKNTGKGIEAIYRLLGSVAWGSTARIAHALTPDPGNKLNSLFVCSKSNIGEKPKGLAFRLMKTEKLAKVEWLGEVNVTADEAMEGESKQSRGERAANWLEEKFSIQREYVGTDIEEMAREEGISRQSLYEPPASQLPILKDRKGHTRPDGKKASLWKWIGPPIEKKFDSKNVGTVGTVGTVSRNPIQGKEIIQYQGVDTIDTVGTVSETVPDTVPRYSPNSTKVEERWDSYKSKDGNDLRDTVPTVPTIPLEGNKKRGSNDQGEGGGIAFAIKVLVDVLRYGERPRVEVERIIREKGIPDEALFEALERLEVQRIWIDDREVWGLKRKVQQ